METTELPTNLPSLGTPLQGLDLECYLKGGGVGVRGGPCKHHGLHQIHVQRGKKESPARPHLVLVQTSGV